jgi:hypothetical protein
VVKIGKSTGNAEFFILAAEHDFVSRRKGLEAP